MIFNNKEFIIFSMNYSLAQRKNINEIKTSKIIKQWEIYQKFKKINLDRNLKYKKFISDCK